MKRRQFIGMAAAGGAGLLWSVPARDVEPCPLSPLATPQLLEILRDDRVVRDLGRRYRKIVPDEDNAPALAQAILSEPPAPASAHVPLVGTTERLRTGGGALAQAPGSIGRPSAVGQPPLLGNAVLGNGDLPAALRFAPSDPVPLRARIAEQVRRDFADGRTVTLNGWILAVTEARQCALYSLL